MKLLNKLVASLTMIGALASVQVAHADPVLDAGWSSDQIDYSATDSIYSPYLYALSGPAVMTFTTSVVRSTENSTT